MTGKISLLTYEILFLFRIRLAATACKVPRQAFCKQIVNRTPCQHRVYDPDRQDRPNTREDKCHLYFVSVETEALREFLEGHGRIDCAIPKS